MNKPPVSGGESLPPGFTMDPTGETLILGNGDVFKRFDQSTKIPEAAVGRLNVEMVLGDTINIPKQTPVSPKAPQKPADKSRMTDHYTKTETDLMLKNLEQKVEHGLEKVLFAVEKGFQEVKADNKSLQTDIGWMKNLYAWLLFPLVVGFLLIATGYVLEKMNGERPPGVYNVFPNTVQPPLKSKSR